MFKRLIVATDLSNDSTTFINCLGGLKAYGTKECLLLQIRVPGEALGAVNPYKATEFVEYEKIFQSQKEILEKQGYKVETRILTGFLANEINRIAIEEDYSAIAAGAEKNCLSVDAFFSALASELIYIAQKPILLIRPDGCEVGNHVLFPTDFSENADVAFSYIVEMAAGKAKKITLFHVQDKSRISPHLEDRLEEFNKIDTDRLQSMKKILQEKGNAEVEIVLKYGSPSVEILNFVKEHNVQLVVMGSQGRGFVNEFFLGSVSHNIARHSRSSVLLVPAKRKE